MHAREEYANHTIINLTEKERDKIQEEDIINSDTENVLVEYL